VVDSYGHRKHAAFVSKLNKPRSDKGLQRVAEGYQQSYPQKNWTSSESLAKSSTCHRKCMRNPMAAGAAYHISGMLSPIDSAVVHMFGAAAVPGLHAATMSTPRHAA
jgi:hypothetical protein